MSINWARLVAQGRAKAMGVSWSEEEQKAIHQHKIPVEYVREGILTPKDYQKALKGETGEKPLERLKKAELVEKAKEMGIEIADEDSITRGDIILEIQNKEDKK